MRQLFEGMRMNNHRRLLEQEGSEFVESWHFKRTCAKCGEVWAGLHCIHDRSQNPCPQCRFVPEVNEDECNCEFDWDDWEEYISSSLEN